MRCGGLDVGGRQDFTALLTVEDYSAGRLAVVSVRRLPLGMDIIEQVPALAADIGSLDALAVDVGGVGAAVPGLIRATDPPRLQALLPVHIVAGTGERENDGRLSVGKHRLVGHLESAMRSQRITLDPAAPGAADLRDELVLFVRRAGRVDAAAGHDDLVLGLALAVWCADSIVGRSTAPPAFPDRLDGCQPRADDWRRQHV